MESGGYRKLEPVHQSRNTLVWRAVQESDGRPVVLKHPARDNPPPGIWDGYRHEAALLEELAGAPGPTLCALVDSGTAPLLVMEDAGGVALPAWRRGAPVDWRQALPVAHQLAEAVRALHAHHILHLAIQPDHVVVLPDGGVRLIDFQQARRLVDKEPLPVEAADLDGALAYLAPEQTGRVLRRLDERSDLYALGATLYFLLTGQPPFPDQSPMALVHAHLARRPTPPSQLQPDLPSPLSDLVLRLLQKEPDARYHSAVAVGADLAVCLEHAEQRGTLTGVILGREEDPVALPVPPRLYGDDPTTRALSEAWTAVRDGGVATILIRSDPGGGKSARLAQAVSRVEGEAGLVVRGRFQPDEQRVPYAGLLRMVDPLVAQLLYLSDAEVTVWRARLEHRLAGDVSVLAGLPHWRALMGHAIGDDPTPPGATPDLRRALTRLIETLAEDGTVVLAWDDVEWADTYSEEVMRSLLAADLRGGLLLMATANQSDPPNPHDRVRATWGAAAGAHTVVLPALDITAVRTWLAEMLRRPLAAVTELAQILTDRSAGNPAGVRQLLDVLWREDALRYDRPTKSWAWDLAAAQQLEPRAPVVAGLLRRVAGVSTSTARHLRWAAALGDRFDPTVLALALNWPLGALRALEGELRGTGVVEDAPAEGRGRPGLRFVHPGVWEALKGAGSAADRQEAHLGLARVLGSRQVSGAPDADLYQLARHYNEARGAPVAEEDRWAAAAANLAAGRRAAERGAWAEGLELAQSGVRWLPAEAFAARYDLARDLHALQMDAQYARYDFDGCEATAAVLREHGASFADRALAYVRWVEIWAARGEGDRIRREGRLFLADAGVTLADPVTEAEVHALYLDVRARRRERSVAEWAAAPRAAHEAAEPVARLIQGMVRALGDGDGLGNYLALYGLRLSLQEGWTPCGPGFCFGPLARVDLGDAEGLADALEWGALALALWERADLRGPDPGAALPFVLRVAHFRQTFSGIVERLEHFSQVARLGGQEPEALVHAPVAIVARLLASEPLEPLLQRTDERLDEAATKRVAASAWQLGHLSAVLRRWRALPVPDAPTTRPGSADDRWLAAYLAGWTELLFGQEEADPWTAPDAPPHRLALLEPELAFLEAVRRARRAPASDDGADQERWAALRQRIGVWAGACPDNYRARALLLDALDSARRGEAASDLFAQAVHAAEASGSVLVSAFIHEEAARADRAAGRAWEALPHLLAAFRLYSRWGLTAKAQQMMAQHPELDDFVAPAPVVEENLSVDLEAMVQTSAALAQEVQLDRLVTVLLETARLQAGAERGALLLERSDGWWVEAIREGDAAGGTFLPEPLATTRRVPASLVRYVVRTGGAVRLDEAAADRRFGGDAYFRRQPVRSALALPVVKQGTTLAVLYLDNGLTARAFPPDRVSLLQLWAGQAGVSIENARVYGELEARVAARTEDLAVALDTLRRAQRQMVEGEKMASLGQLTAGVAHEINNPVNFVVSSVPSLRRDVQDLMELLDLYEGAVREHDLAAQFQVPIQYAETIDAAYTRQEVAELLRGIEDGAQRTAEIVRGLRNFSRLDEDDVKLAVVSEGVESTLMLVKQQCGTRITIERDYGDVPPIECYPGQLNQVFMNLLVNAIQAIPGEGTIRVAVHQLEDSDVEVRISDTGIGMPPDVQRRIFEPFYTTKGVGEGTGLGLSISYGIVERHHGHLSVESTPGVGTTFIIRIPRRQPTDGAALRAGAASADGTATVKGSVP